MLQRKELPAVRPKLYDIVELRSDVTEEGTPPWGGTVTAGSQGTIVDELEEGIYLVEFQGNEGDPAILTLPAHLLTLRWTAPV